MEPISIHQTPQRKPKPDTKSLGFGKYFSDHMFLCEHDSAKGWTHPRIEPYGPLSMDPGASIFHYGQAMFEGMKAFRSQSGQVNLFRPMYHIERMINGSSRLCLPPPPRELMKEAILKLVNLDQDWVPKEKGSSLYIRPTLIGTEAFLGVRPSQKALLFVICSPVQSYYSEGFRPVKIWIETEHVRAAHGGLGAVKAGSNYVAGMQAAVRAKARGFTQVLWTDACEHRYVEEVGTMNVFFRFKNEVATPPLSGTILAGSTRECVLKLLNEWKIPATERPISVDEIRQAHAKGELLEVFGTGTAAVISPVGELGYKDELMKINGSETGELAKRLQTEITSIQHGLISDRFKWLHPIDKG